MDRFEYYESKFTAGEFEIARERGVKLYDGDVKVNPMQSKVTF